MKQIYYLLFVFLVFTSSCKKDFQFAMKTKHWLIPAESFSFWSEAEKERLELSLPVDGYMVIGNNSTHFNQASIPGDHILVEGFILNSSGTASDFGIFSIDSTDFITPSLSNGHYGYQVLPGTINLSYLFGNTNDYSLSGNSSSGFPGFSNESLYFPEAIIITSPKYIPGGTDTIKLNDKVTWNSDPSDSIGVSISIQYDPIDNVANGLVSNHPNPIIKRYYVPDDGSFQLTSSILSYFPIGSKLGVEVARGTYKRVKATGPSTYHIGIINYTKISTKIQLL